LSTLFPTPFLAYLIYPSNGKHKERNANAENNNITNPPLPLTLEQVLVMLAQMLQSMQ
jgi:hypothetical protein